MFTINVEIVKQVGTSKMLEYLTAIGGSPFLNRSTIWDSMNFDLKTVFEAEPADATSMILDHKLRKCSDPEDPSKEVLCLRFDSSWVNTNSSQVDMVELLLDMNDAYLAVESRKKNLKSQVDEAVNQFFAFNNLKVSKMFIVKSRRKKF